MSGQVEKDLALRLLRQLEGRRRELRMSMGIVAERCGLGLRTIQRVLSGLEPKANLATVLLIANALGLELTPSQRMSAHRFRQQQANQKAAKLASMVQGTSALESQAVPEPAQRDIRHQIAARLISGSPRELWSR
jgi:DNA-binding phage protein